MKEDVGFVMLRTRVLRLRPTGMFSNVNEVVEHLRLAKTGGYQFVINWRESCYADPARNGDPWSYYFEPVFPHLRKPILPSLLKKLPTGKAVACTIDNIITPRLQDGQCDPLLLPRDRLGANRLMADHIRPNTTVAQIATEFRATRFRSKVIGLHIRGPGRTDGGVPNLRRKLDAVGKVPFAPFFEALDEKLQTMPDAAIFACSDSSQVIEAVQDRYGDRVITYAATRSVFGEMHADHAENAGQVFEPYKLGMDVLVEALLLASTDFFVHGNSNVANFILCQSPALDHAYVAA